MVEALTPGAKPTRIRSGAYNSPAVDGARGGEDAEAREAKMKIRMRAKATTPDKLKIRFNISLTSSTLIFL